MICLLLFLFSNSKSTAHYLTEIWTGVKGSKAKTCSKFYYSNIYQLLNTSTGTRNYILMLKYLQSSLFSAFIQSIQCIKSTTSISFHTTCITVHYFPRTFRVTVYCGIFVTWWAWAGLGGGGGQDLAVAYTLENFVDCSVFFCFSFLDQWDLSLVWNWIHNWV